MDALATDLIVATRARLEELGPASVEEVREHPVRLVGLGPELKQENQRVKRFLLRNLYSHREVSAERKKIKRALEGLFRFFLEHPRSLPPTHHAKLKDEPLHRVVGDYIAGMTDHYLLEQHRKHVGD
jgi:dGTPase